MAASAIWRLIRDLLRISLLSEGSSTTSMFSESRSPSALAMPSEGAATGRAVARRDAVAGAGRSAHVPIPGLRPNSKSCATAFAALTKALVAVLGSGTKTVTQTDLEFLAEHVQRRRQVTAAYRSLT